jgi:hypothetical protein
MQAGPPDLLARLVKTLGPLILVYASIALAAAQVLTFSPQPGYRRIAVWGVSGCPGKAVPIAQIRTIAAQRGIDWWTATTAAQALRRRTAWGIALDIATGGAIVGAAATNLEWIATQPGWKVGFTAGAGALGIIAPIIKGHAPVVDPFADRDLTIDSAGCGTTMFYAAPLSKATAFVAQLTSGADTNLVPAAETMRQHKLLLLQILGPNAKGAEFGRFESFALRRREKYE